MLLLKFRPRWHTRRTFIVAHMKPKSVVVKLEYVAKVVSLVWLDVIVLLDMKEMNVVECLEDVQNIVNSFRKKRNFYKFVLINTPNVNIFFSITNETNFYIGVFANIEVCRLVDSVNLILQETANTNSRS
mgnify:CR=1 FL=1